MNDDARLHLTRLLQSLESSGGSISFSVNFGSSGDRHAPSGVCSTDFVDKVRALFGVPDGAESESDILSYLERRLTQIQGDRNEADLLFRTVKDHLIRSGTPKGETTTYLDIVRCLKKAEPG